LLIKDLNQNSVMYISFYSGVVAFLALTQ